MDTREHHLRQTIICHSGVQRQQYHAFLARRRKVKRPAQLAQAVGPREVRRRQAHDDDAGSAQRLSESSNDIVYILHSVNT